MKKLVLVVMVMAMLGFSTLTFGGEKEELQLKARALVAEANLAQSNTQLWQIRGTEAQKAIQEFIKELDQKGFMATPDGNIVEKTKPVAPSVAPQVPVPKTK